MEGTGVAKDATPLELYKPLKILSLSDISEGRFEAEIQGVRDITLPCVLKSTTEKSGGFRQHS